jgi:hypothetical protein
MLCLQVGIGGGCARIMIPRRLPHAMQTKAKRGEGTYALTNIAAFCDDPLHFSHLK